MWKNAMEFDGVVVVDFFMSYCGPCGVMKPMLHALEKVYKQNGAPLLMTTIEIDDIPAMSRKYRVGAVPALFFFVKGEKSGKEMIGLKEKDDVKKRIDAEIAKLKR